MAGSEATPKAQRSKNKKRKQRSLGASERPSKTQRIIVSEKESEPQEMIEVGADEKHEAREPSHKLEEGGPWRNLELVLSIQNKEIDLEKKVELAYGFVISRAKEEGGKSNQDTQAVNMSRLIIFVNDWIQSLLISSGKKIQSGGEKHQAEVIDTYLDVRCWEIFKFCLEESLKVNVSLNLSRNLLHSIDLIARNALSLLNKTSSRLTLFSSSEGLQLYNTVLDCIALVFSSHGGLSNENLDLWVSTVGAVLDLVHKFYGENLACGNGGDFVFRFVSLVFEPFAKFLRAHPARKNGFRDFINKLLEPLLHLLGLLHLQIEGINPDWTRNLLKLVEEVLSHGLYHPIHIDGFLSLCSSEKYATSNSGKSKDSKTTLKSYHRHLFDKLERILAGKNALAVESIGELFRLLIDQVKKLKRASVVTQNTKMMGKTEGSTSTALAEKNYCSTSFNAETRKSLLDFFVLIMEPLLLEINGYLETKLEMGPVLLDVHCTLKSVNNLVFGFMHERVYVRTEDTSTGACLNFLKKVYNMIISLSSNLIQSSKYDVVNRTHVDALTLIANEVLSAVGYLMEIEYEVVENDLVSLWLLMLSHLAIGISLMDVPDRCSLSFKITDIGCQLVVLYSQLRQVNNTIFALCKAIRLLSSHNGDGERNYTRFVISLHGEGYAKSVEMLLCSQEFKIAIQQAIKSIPEGQASGFIGQLTVDISESLEWMKISCSKSDEKEVDNWDVQSSSHGFNLEAELLGRGLSEMYALVLDSLFATTGNCNLLGVSIKDLIALLFPCMGHLVSQQPDSLNKFLFSVTGKGFDIETAENKTNLLIFGLSTHWVFVFFFRLYMSCQSLYRSATSLMPPDLSRKMSAAMGDSFASYSGSDWMEMTDWTSGGYFSWIKQPSAPLLVVIQSISNIYCKNCATDSWSLTYVMHAMAFRRLVDLNRHIKSSEYVMQHNKNLVQVRLPEDAGLSRCHKRIKKLERHISALREEAAGLTGFLMEHLSLVSEDQRPIFTSDDTSCTKMVAQETDEWDFSVSALNKKSLPTAIWWILCHNIDTWCTHATKKNLKTFLSLLIQTSLPCVRSSFGVVREHNNHAADRMKKVTLHQVSSHCFIDSILYEQRFVRRHFASSFCRALENSTVQFISDFSSGDCDFKSSPNWVKVLNDLENSSVVVSSNKHNVFDRSSIANPVTGASDKLLTGSCKEQEALPLTIMKFTACQSLLNLLCHMPKGHLSSRSISLYVTSILNLERLLVGGLLDCQNALNSHHYHELFRLFVSCRKALKCIILACEEKTAAGQTSHASVLLEDTFPVSWLYKSVYAVLGIQESFSKDNRLPFNDMILSLMDHTFYVFLTSSKYQLNHVDHRPNASKLNAETVHEHSNSRESDQCLDPSNSIDARKSVGIIAKSLTEQMQSVLLNLKNGPYKRKVGIDVDALNLNKFSSLISCLCGYLWGLVCVVNHTNVRNSDRDHEANSSRRKLEPITELNLCINVFAEFSSLLLQMLLFDNNQQSRTLCDAQNIQKTKVESGTEDFLPEGTGVETDIACGGLHNESGVAMTCSASRDIHDDSGSGSVRGRKLHLKGAVLASSALTDVDSFELQSLNKPLLRRLLKGDYPDAAFLLRQLFIASSAILRLSLHMNSAPLSSSLVHSFTGITQVLFLESVDMNHVPHFFYFVCLDGVLKYLEELAKHFPLTNPTLSRNLYDKMVQLQLRALGKCITLQGKRATLVSHETESSTKMLHSPMGFSEASLSGWPYLLDELKARLRSSFRVFIERPSELHLLSALQAIERALVGVREGCTMSYDIHTGSADGGKVSSVVAAGIDCLDLVLEFVSGHKRLKVVKKYIQSFIASVFNVILHLQSPLIFYERVIQSKGDTDTDPDPGTVILMCVDVLVRISGKHALYQMEPWHVAQSLRIPSALFQDFHLLKLSEAPIPDDSSTIPNNQVSNPVASSHFSGIDRQYSVDLFSACCRLLHNVLKHHKSECERCVAILEASVRILLHCLETVDADAVVKKGFFSWEVAEGVKCAGSLRRIYEEIRHQKDVFGPHCAQFLSNYIWVYSGHGPRKTGIKREIDEALRPGVYALIDTCSPDDLQRLHTIFGEGPCRNTLATLKHDYELNFQYQGKV
ncbi:uncharacterized protein LOC103958506 [Pyrus x bretschneideri]|uniref:uncharacterized protein LOC103958506 n=1 Tax=Pyrus x bretschneideri TaxID=225117 RepID=UPI00202FF53E|nr:uncharacterized protein LOC103958506 [Pyrus x bretschneideri]